MHDLKKAYLYLEREIELIKKPSIKNIETMFKFNKSYLMSAEDIYLYFVMPFKLPKKIEVCVTGIIHASISTDLNLKYGYYHTILNLLESYIEINE